ncbi:MAG TPA: hypothetical protein VIJ82_07710 [Streptosporangiaceae bacterium]|jgi:hypothetical protein
MADVRNLRRSSGILRLTVLAFGAAALPAQAGTVGPKQYFTGVINGEDGNTTIPVFTRYDQPQPLPTSLTLPCAGTGTVWFTPIPVVPPSQSATAPVRYVGRP